MFNQFTPLRKPVILLAASLSALATAAPQANAAFTYLSGSRSVEADGVVYNGPAVGPWDKSTSYPVQYWPLITRANQSTTLTPLRLPGRPSWGGGLAQAVSDPLSTGSAVSRMEVVFTSDVATGFQLYVAGDMSTANPTTVSIWRIDPVLGSETLISHATTAFSLMQMTAGALEAGPTYRLYANASPTSVGGGVVTGEWSVGFPVVVPTPGGIALIAPLALCSIRRRR
ncbi:MAG: hypothetical protein ACKVZJ_07575 [Phycisphaerales bacterium]